MLNFDIQNHRPLREIVYEELKMQILTGKIVPGTRLMEVELAADMGVSRTPIREAIRKLEPRPAHRFGGTKHSQNHFVIVVKFGQLNIAANAARKHCAQFALQTAAGHNGLLRHRIAHSRAVNRAYRGKRVGCANVHTSQNLKITVYDNLSVHYLSLPPK